jgi:hypothetical protein
MKKYKSIDALISAAMAGDIPTALTSPGGAAQMLGISRQAVNYRVHHSCSLEAYGAQGYVFITERSIKAALKFRELGVVNYKHLEAAS